MKSKILIALCCLLLFFSCAKKKDLKKLKEKETFYFYENSSRPFSGRVYSKKVTLADKQFIAGFYSFYQGIPQGKWKSFDYYGTTMQEGIWEPVTDVLELKPDLPNISRINICKYNEGKYSIIDLYVISKKIETDSLLFVSKKSKVFDFLIKKGILKEEDFKLVNSCEIYSGEF